MLGSIGQLILDGSNYISETISGQPVFQMPEAVQCAAEDIMCELAEFAKQNPVAAGVAAVATIGGVAGAGVAGKRILSGESVLELAMSAEQFQGIKGDKKALAFMGQLFMKHKAVFDFARHLPLDNFVKFAKSTDQQKKNFFTNSKGDVTSDTTKKAIIVTFFAADLECNKDLGLAAKFADQKANKAAYSEAVRTAIANVEKLELPKTLAETKAEKAAAEKAAKEAAKAVKVEVKAEGDAAPVAAADATPAAPKQGWLAWGASYLPSMPAMPAMPKVPYFSKATPAAAAVDADADKKEVAAAKI